MPSTHPATLAASRHELRKISIWLRASRISRWNAPDPIPHPQAGWPLLEGPLGHRSLLPLVSVGQWAGRGADGEQEGRKAGARNYNIAKVKFKFRPARIP